MKFIEVLPHFLAGKKIKRYGGIADVVKGIGAIFYKEDFESNNWEIVEEPKPKKKVWQWRVLKRHAHGYCWEVDNRLLTEDEAKEIFRLSYGGGCYAMIEKHGDPIEVDAE